MFVNKEVRRDLTMNMSQPLLVIIAIKSTIKTLFRKYGNRAVSEELYQQHSTTMHAEVSYSSF
jgi:hypothetical protein